MVQDTQEQSQENQEPPEAQGVSETKKITNDYSAAGDLSKEETIGYRHV